MQRRSSWRVVRPHDCAQSSLNTTRQNESTALTRVLFVRSSFLYVSVAAGCTVDFLMALSENQRNDVLSQLLEVKSKQTTFWGNLAYRRFRSSLAFYQSAAEKQYANGSQQEQTEDDDSEGEKEREMLRTLGALAGIALSALMNLKTQQRADLYDAVSSILRRRLEEVDTVDCTPNGAAAPRGRGDQAPPVEAIEIPSLPSGDVPHRHFPPPRMATSSSHDNDDVHDVILAAATGGAAGKGVADDAKAI